MCISIYVQDVKKYHRYLGPGSLAPVGGKYMVKYSWSIPFGSYLSVTIMSYWSALWSVLTILLSLSSSSFWMVVSDNTLNLFVNGKANRKYRSRLWQCLLSHIFLLHYIRNIPSNDISALLWIIKRMEPHWPLRDWLYLWTTKGSYRFSLLSQEVSVETSASWLTTNRTDR